MYRRSMAAALVSMFLVTLAIAPAAARRTNNVLQLAPNTPGHTLALTPGASPVIRHAPAVADTFVLGEWDFDNGTTADPQGWTTFDRTAQPGTFFTVEDFAGLAGQIPGWLAPLSGQRSLWCGARSVSGMYGPYATLPGYGNNWDQFFESRVFAVSGSVTVSFLVRYDSEPSYDQTDFEYQSKTGDWRRLLRFEYSGTTLATATVPADSIAGLLRLRFHFVSDGLYSDEDGLRNSDGAVIIDSLTVRDASGVVDFQDFESEVVGTHYTADGDWTAWVRSYGDHAALFDGSTVLQLDPLVSNQTHLWGFFNGSTANYACGGHPEQTAVPFARDVGGKEMALNNWIVSPLIPITQDVHGVPLENPARIVLEFDVYRDLPLDNMIFYTYWVRSWDGARPSAWRSNNYVYYRQDGPADWFRFQMNVIGSIDPGATHIQVAIEAIDLCPVYCGIWGNGACHSNAPLIDNVRVIADNAYVEYVVTNTNDSGAGSLRQAITDAKGPGVPARIVFDIPGTGFHEISLATVLPGLTTSQIVIDGTSQPGYDGTPLVGVKLVFTGNVKCFWLEGGRCALYGLKITHTGSTGSAIYIRSDENIVEGCEFVGWGTAVEVSGNGNRIGGPGVGEGNSFAANGTGVYVASGTRNTIRGNSMANNSALAIDLAPAWVTANDSLDVDTGANNRQNFPVIRFYDATEVIGELSSVPGGLFTVDFYANTACGPWGYGEGKTYLGSTEVTTDATGNAWFMCPLAVPEGSLVTATATDASGNTSEFSACGPSTGSVFVVTEQRDPFPGCFRDAITAAHNHPGLDVIRFALPGTGPFPIGAFKGSEYPLIMDPVVIDGFSQPGATPNTNPIDQPCNAVLQVRTSTIRVETSGCLIRGLNTAGTRTGNYGLIINGDNNRVEGCFLGTDVTGMIPGSNGGLYINGSNNVIGGLTPQSRNLICGTTDAPARSAYIPGSHNIIEGNFIGLDATGNAAMARETGIEIVGGDNQIGGGETAARNVIAGQRTCIRITGATATGNRITGNYVGLDRTGLVDLSPVGISGSIEAIRLESGASYNLIGHATAAERNVIVGLTGVGVISSYNNAIEGNYLGTDVSGVVLPGAHSVGVYLTGTGADRNWIGGQSAGEGNLIAGFADQGVRVEDGRGNRVLGNSIHSIGNLGIDLWPSGVTANDAGDVDAGPNDGQNYPALGAVVTNSGQTQVSGTLSTSLNGTYRLEFFANDVCHASGHGPGMTYLGSTSVATDGAGEAAFACVLNTVAPAGWFMSATATDALGNTSEFSACVEVVNTPGGNGVTSTPVDATTGGNPATLTFANVTVPGNTTLVTGPTGPPLPGSFQAGENTFYNISTTATFTGSVEVCITYNPASLLVPETALRLLHYDAAIPDWVDVTTSLNTITNVVCGDVTSFSPFVLAASTTTGVTPTPAIPNELALHPNVPNPFNPTTAIGYDVPKGGADVTIVIYDVAGRRVRTLVREHRTPGRYQATWDGRTDRGELTASGVYFCQMKAGSFVQTRKLVLLK